MIRTKQSVGSDHALCPGNHDVVAFIDISMSNAFHSMLLGLSSRDDVGVMSLLSAL